MKQKILTSYSRVQCDNVAINVEIAAVNNSQDNRRSCPLENVLLFQSCP